MKYLLRIQTYNKGALDVPYDTEEAAHEALAKLKAHIAEGAGKYSSFRGIPQFDVTEATGLLSVVPHEDEALTWDALASGLPIKSSVCP
jgi:hypothetical protein